MKQRNMWSYLNLDSFDIEISFSISKKELICLLKERNILLYTPMERQVVIKSNMFSLDICFFIAFDFNDEQLTSITMSPEKVLEGSTLYLRYNKIQKSLENQLGHSRNCLQKVINLLDPNNQLACWKSDEIEVEHCLRDRFGMEEIIKIKRIGML